MELMRNKMGNENVSEFERWASVIGGGMFMLYALKRQSRSSLPIALLGGSFVYRGATGQCYIYKSLGISTSGQGEAYERGISVEKAMTISKSPEELYRFWRDFENLPRFMSHLESVETIDSERSRWVVKAPMGRTVGWDAEITEDRENEIISWRSLEGADVDNAGSVRFEKAKGGRGTVVKVSLQYNPPGGTVGATVAKLFGEEPEQQIQEDLRRFKQLMETGEIPTTEGQPSGRSAETGSESARRFQKGSATGNTERTL